MTDKKTPLEETIVRPVRTPKVAVVIMAEGDSVRAAAEGVAEQEQDILLMVAGDGPGAKREAEELGAVRRESLQRAVRSVSADIDYVWILAGLSRPKKGALAAMLAVAEHHQVAVVGSKILAAEDEEHLLSVGSATDLFGVPSSGLDELELDFAQYDVVREVSGLSTASILVRRRLAVVLGGLDPALSPVASGLDFCQRVRLAGGRVAIAPASRVLYPGERFPRFAGWRERAGRMRAMFKVYRLMTLAWAIPVDILINLGDGLLNLVLGRPSRLVGFLMAVGWNMLKFPSTIGARFQSQKVRRVGDEDLFRYQMSGSVTLRDMGSEIGGRIGDFGPADRSWALTISTRLRGGTPLALLVSLLFLAAASRSIWLGGLPATGFSFPPGDDPASVLSAYAGGWNDAGLGNTLPPHPSAVLMAALHWLMLGWSGSQVLVTALCLWAGLVGSSRMFRTMGIGGAASYAGAVVYLLGAAAASVLSQGYWPAMLAWGALPWAVAASVRPWAPTWRYRIGDLALASLACAVLAASAPVAVAAPAAIVLVGWAGGTGWTFSSFARALAGGAVGLSAVGAYLWATDLGFWSHGPGLAWEPDWMPWVAVGLAGVTALVFGGPRLRGAAGAGLALAGAGLWVGDVPWWEVKVAGAALAAVGAGAAVGAAFSAGEKGDDGHRRLGGMVALLIAVAALTLTLGTVQGGRAGLPIDRWSDRLDFAASLSEAGDGSRVLLVGPERTLPGMERRGEGYSYRLLKAGPPTLEQAWLAPEAVGDRALAETLAEMSVSPSLRPGELLAPFAVRWVVVSPETDFADQLAAQVDMRLLSSSAETMVYENLAALSRAHGPYVGAWDSVGPGLVEGPEFQGRIRIGDNAHPRWGPDWTQDSWWNTIGGADGEGRFDPYPLARILAWWGGALTVLLAGLVWWGRGAFR